MRHVLFRALLQRLALICLGLVTALLALEIFLHVAAAYTAWRGHRLPTTWTTARPRILCVGDSNTYGLRVDQSESYPGQLQVLLGERAEVLNIGYPGTNSSHLRRDFAGMLDTFRPDVVLLLIGANDFWTVPVAADSRNGGADVRAWLWRVSRVYRMLYMMARAGEALSLSVTRLPADVDLGEGSGRVRYGDAEFEFHWRARFVAGWRNAYRKNLTAMIGTAASYGVKLVLLTYGSELGVYGAINRLIRSIAKERDLQVVDAGQRFRVLCGRTPLCPEFFFADGHPTAEGYSHVAQLVAAALQGRE